MSVELTEAQRRALGWAAVLVQLAALVGIVRTTSSDAPSWLRLLGLLVIVAGAAMMVVSFLNLGRSLTPTPVPNRAGLRTEGLYRWVRHPIYTGLILLALGLVLRGPGGWAMFWFAVLVAVLTVKAVWEESMLIRTYPGYAEYRRSVGRFVPRVRRSG